MKQIDIQTSRIELHRFLTQLGWIENEEIKDISTPGDGNMNVVLRVKTNTRSFILKQSRPFVQKYQDIPAPLSRIDTEFQFYSATALSPFKEHLPQVLAYDQSEHLMMMEDLGACEDMTSIYAKRTCSDHNLTQLISIIESVHRQLPPSNYPLNQELRALNHQHIFILPFIIDNGFDLNSVQSGLQELSLPFKKDQDLKSIIDQLGNQYLTQGDTLLHGDYYPGSWMNTPNRIFILDPEFSFIGFKEFDIGVLAAHLILSSSDPKLLESIYSNYAGSLDHQLVKRIAGVEIMRRIIGLAQLSLDRTIVEKNELLQIAYKLITD